MNQDLHKSIFQSHWIWLLVFVLGLAGCSKTTFTWDQGRSAVLVGIVNDSLAIYASSRCWQKEVNDPWAIEGDMGYTEGCSHIGLHLVNYRIKQAPLWGDTVGYDLGVIGQVSDSVVLVTDNNGKNGFWKVGNSQPGKLKSWAWTSESCGPGIVGEKRIRPWKNGTFLLLGSSLVYGSPLSRGGDSCQYAVLDTSKGIVLQRRFTGNDAWLVDCKDISYFNGKEVCMQKKDTAGCGMNFMVDNAVTDSLRVDSCDDLYEITFYGHYERLNINYLGSNWSTYGQPILKVNIDSMIFDKNFPEARFESDGMGILNSSGNAVKYSGADLMISGGGGK